MIVEWFIERTQKMGRVAGVVTLEEKLTKILSNTGEL